MAAAVPAVLERLTALPQQVAAAGSAEHRSARRDRPAFRAQPARQEPRVHPEPQARPERRVAAGNCCSDADLPDRCLGAGRQPEASAASLMEPLPEVAAEAEEAAVTPAAMVQPLREVRGEVAAVAALQAEAVVLSVARPAVAEELGAAAAAVAAKEDARPGAAAEEPAAQLEAEEVAVEEAQAVPLVEAAAKAQVAGARPAVEAAAVPQRAVAVPPAGGRREAVQHLEVGPSAVASRPSFAVRAGPGPAGPGRRRTCPGRPQHVPARWFARATASSKSLSLPAGQHQSAS